MPAAPPSTPVEGSHNESCTAVSRRPRMHTSSRLHSLALTGAGGNNTTSIAHRYPASSALEDLKHQLPPWATEPGTVAAVSAVLAVAATIGGARAYKRWFKRIPNADSVTMAMIDRKPTITGVVTRVGDGDGFRLYHTPGPFWRWPLKLRRVPDTPKALKDQTLSIRLAGVDAPELAHFGNPAQPYGKEALEWLTNAVQGKRVKVQLLRKDQYNRIVGIPYLPRRLLPNKPIPLMMLRDGMAVVYTQGGSEYGPWGLDKMRSVEDEAKRARRGLWSAKKIELPSEYKKRVKEGEGESEAKQVKMGKDHAPGWWGALGRWLGRKT